jgi:hypothetical protein
VAIGRLLRRHKEYRGKYRAIEDKHSISLKRAINAIFKVAAPQSLLFFNSGVDLS